MNSFADTRSWLVDPDRPHTVKKLFHNQGFFTNSIIKAMTMYKSDSFQVVSSPSAESSNFIKYFLILHNFVFVVPEAGFFGHWPVNLYFHKAEVR